MLQCRGFLLNFGVYHAAREALGLPFVWNPAVAFLARFMTCFALVIAVTKDLPDIEGDRLFGVETFATKMVVPPPVAPSPGPLRCCCCCCCCCCCNHCDIALARTTFYPTFIAPFAS